MSQDKPPCRLPQEPRGEAGAAAETGALVALRIPQALVDRAERLRVDLGARSRSRVFREALWLGIQAMERGELRR